VREARSGPEDVGGRRWTVTGVAVSPSAVCQLQSKIRRARRDAYWAERR